VIRDFLEAEGFEVEVARNGQEALATLARTQWTACYWTSGCPAARALNAPGVSARTPTSPSLSSAPAIPRRIRFTG
jgi:CheY-like chemotaxis protein